MKYSNYTACAATARDAYSPAGFLLKPHLEIGKAPWRADIVPVAAKMFAGNPAEGHLFAQQRRQRVPGSGHDRIEQRRAICADAAESEHFSGAGTHQITFQRKITFQVMRRIVDQHEMRERCGLHLPNRSSEAG